MQKFTGMAEAKVLFEKKKEGINAKKVWEVNCILLQKDLTYIGHTTETYFSWGDRIRILFGMPVIIRSVIYTNTENVSIIGDEITQTLVPNLVLYKLSIKFSNWLIKKINGNNKNRITSSVLDSTNNSSTYTAP